MKKTKTYYPIVAASCLAFGTFIPMSAGSENANPQSAPTTQMVKDDPLVTELTTSVIDPLNQQAKRWGGFSRRKPTHSISYHLVENNGKESSEERTFSVMMKQTPLSKTGEEKSSEYLKLRHGKKNDQVLVMVKDSWVGLEEHPILKRLSKAKPAIATEPPSTISS